MFFVPPRLPNEKPYFASFLSSSFSLSSLGITDLPKVLIMGDSISIGYTPHVVENLKGVAEVQRHKGNAGPTIRGVAKIEEWLGNGKWDLIHFNWGLWDMYGWEYHQEDRSPEAYGQRLEFLVARLKKTGAQTHLGDHHAGLPGPRKNHEAAVQARGSDPKGSRAEIPGYRPWRDEKKRCADQRSACVHETAMGQICDCRGQCSLQARGKKALGKKVSDCIADALKERVSGNN